MFYAYLNTSRDGDDKTIETVYLGPCESEAVDTVNKRLAASEDSPLSGVVKQLGVGTVYHAITAKYRDSERAHRARCLSRKIRPS